MKIAEFFDQLKAKIDAAEADHGPFGHPVCCIKCYSRRLRILRGLEV